jgi:hypothetical protein
LSDKQLAALVDAAISVLQESGDASQADDSPISQLPPSAMTKQLAQLLDTHGAPNAQEAAARISKDKTVAREVSLLMLKQIATEPELAAKVEAIYRQGEKMLFIDGGLIMAAAFLILALKVKKIDLSKGKLEFDKLSDKVVASVFGFLSGGGGGG